MNKSCKFLLFSSLFFTLTLNAMLPPELAKSLGSLKTNLTTLSSTLANLGAPKKIKKIKDTTKYPEESNFKQDDLDMYALYGDDTKIINDEKGVKKQLDYDGEGNLRLVSTVSTDGKTKTLDMRPYTGYGYKTTNLQKLHDIIIEMSSPAAPIPGEMTLTTKQATQAATTIYQKAKQSLTALFTKKPKLASVPYEVPTFIGISSARIKTHLATMGLDISQEWAKAVAPTTISEDEKKDSLKNKNLPEKFISVK